MSLENANSLLNELQIKVQSRDIEGGKSALARTKIAMLDFPVGNASTEAHTLLSVSALELGVLLSVVDQDLDAFARNVSQLKAFYAILAVSSNKKCHLLGLNLMHLLVENNLSEFHAELELLSSEEASTPFISFPVNLERQLTVGSYDEVLSAGSHVPDQSYTFFMENLLQTVRDSIADCLEVSYKTVSIKEAVDIMKFDSSEELIGYIEESRDDWILEGNILCFQPPEVGCKASDIPSMKVISNSLSYATELERII